MAKMETDQAKEIYRRRGAVAEFSNLWIKDKLGLRRFRLRGLVKTGIEAVWASLTYNVGVGPTALEDAVGNVAREQNAATTSVVIRAAHPSVGGGAGSTTD